VSKIKNLLIRWDLVVALGAAATGRSRHTPWPRDWTRIERLIRLASRPEQASGRLETENGIVVSHEWIYRHVYADKRAGGSLHRHLHCQKTRRKRYGTYNRLARQYFPKGRDFISISPVLKDRQTKAISRC
jgi:IS30 family transposase